MPKKQPLTIEQAQIEQAQLSESAAALQKVILDEADFQDLCVGVTSGEEQQYHANRIVEKREQVQVMEKRLKELKAFLAGHHE